jgi:uncharacterized phage protein (TIGR02218 family)
MTYDARETSEALGAPQELYEFVRGAYRVRLTSADRAITFEGQSFAPVAISRTGAEASLEAARANITITVPRTMEVADWHRVAPPADGVAVRVLQRHLADPDNEFAVVWIGRVSSVDFKGAAADLVCESVHTSMRRNGLRRAYQRACPHVVYGAECGAVLTSFQVAGTIASIAGLTVTAAALGTVASGALAGGFLQVPRASGQFERRAIAAHVGSTVTLAQQITGLTAGQAFTAAPGCDHTAATCNARFGRILAYGGMLYIPTKNPFDGSPVY